MGYTDDDALFCVLHSCSDSLSASRLPYYIYLYQVAGLNYAFKYKLRASGVESRAVDSFVNILISEGKLKIDNGKLALTDLGLIYYAEIALTYAEWEHINNIKQFLDNLSDSELYFITITDMIITKELRSKGTKGLITEKDKIKSTISGLSSEYTDENFDNALKAIRYFKEGFSND